MSDVAAAAAVQKPALGKMVHYVDGTGQDCAAIITWPNENGPCGLHVFRPWPPTNSDAIWTMSAPYDEKKRPYTWHWPEA